MSKQKIVIRSTFKSSNGNTTPEYPVELLSIESPILDAAKSVDLQFHNFLLNKFTDKIGAVDRIFIPLSLTDDYLNFTGIRLAIHIRLTTELKDIRQVPIFLMGYESKEDVCKFSNLGFFLFSKGVYLIKELNEEIASNLSTSKEGVTESYISTELLQKIILAPPDFYDNRHSIANEWALLFMDAISGHNILQKKPELQEIQSNLYIKWLMATKGIGIPNNNSYEEKFFIPNAEGKRILLIDDEWNKGWLELFRMFFRHGENDTIVDYIRIDKTSTEEEILKSLKKKLQEEKGWDLFLLDIRLIDDDHKENRYYFDNTGFNLLDVIMESNSGNQVILSSASNKYRLYEYGLEMGAAGGFIKPGLDSSLTLNDLDHFLIVPIRKCFERKILKEVHNETESLINILKGLLDLPDENNEEFIVSLITLLKSGNLAFKKIDSSNNEELGVIFISYFKIFEIIGDYFVKRNNRNGYEIPFFDKDLEEFWVCRKKLCNEKNPQFSKHGPTTFNKIAGILKQILAYSNSEVINIYDLQLKRNKWVHPQIRNIKIKDKKVSKMIDKDMCIDIFRSSIKVLNDLIDKYQ